MNNSNHALRLQFIEAYLRDGAESSTYSNLKNQLYQNGYSRWEVIGMLVESSLYGGLDNFYRKHPNAR